MCNRDNSCGMKALRRGRVTSGIQITDNSKSQIHPSISSASIGGESHKRAPYETRKSPSIQKRDNRATFDQRVSWKQDAPAQCELDNLNSSNV